MKKFTRIAAVVAVLVIAALLIGGAASAQLFPPGPEPGPEPPGATAITSGPGDKMYPAVSGDTIVWLDNATWSVQVYNATSGESLTIPGEGIYATMFMRQVDISGDRVVWTGMSATTGAHDIYLYDATTGSVTPLTSDPALQMSPSISDGFVCWNEIDTTTGKGQIQWQNVNAGDSELAKFAAANLAAREQRIQHPTSSTRPSAEIPLPGSMMTATPAATLTSTGSPDPAGVGSPSNRRSPRSVPLRSQVTGD